MAASVLERWGCLWIVLAVLAAYVAFAMGWQMLFPITRESYENCVKGVMEARQRNVVLCVKERMAEDLEKGRKELPVLPSRAEHEASCRYIWRDIPENSCKPPKISN